MMKMWPKASRRMLPITRSRLAVIRGSWWSAFEDLHLFDFEDGVEGRTLLAVAVTKLPGQGAQVAGSSRRSFMHLHIVGE